MENRKAFAAIIYVLHTGIQLLEKTWISGALRVRDGKELTRCAPSRNSANYIELLKLIEADNPTGDIFIITDNSSAFSTSVSTSMPCSSFETIRQLFKMI